MGSKMVECTTQTSWQAVNATFPFSSVPSDTSRKLVNRGLGLIGLMPIPEI